MTDKLTPQKIKAILAAQKPDTEVDEDVAFEDSVMADDSSVQGHAPDLEYLMRKFLKGKRGSSPPMSSIPVSMAAPRSSAARDSSKATNTSKIVRVKPAGSRPTDAVGTGQRKVVVISAKDESVVAEQG